MLEHPVFEMKFVGFDGKESNQMQTYYSSFRKIQVEKL